MALYRLRTCELIIEFRCTGPLDVGSVSSADRSKHTGGNHFWSSLEEAELSRPGRKAGGCSLAVVTTLDQRQSDGAKRVP
jgi:hypothetical protein